MNAIKESVASAVARARRNGAGELTPEAVAEFRRQLFNDLREAGFADIAVSEDRGGGGGTIDELAEAVRALGEEGVCLPLAELNIGMRLCEAGGVEDRFGETVLFVDSAAAVSGRTDGSLVVELKDCPWLPFATAVVLPGSVDGEYLIVDVRGADLEESLIGDVPAASTTASPSSGEVEVFQAGDIRDQRDLLSWLRVQEAAGLVAGAYAMTAEYASQRNQFGRAIETFPAVQELLIRTAQAVVVCTSAASRLTLAAQEDKGLGTALATAVQLVSTEVMHAVRGAHQVHGAIGMTQEYNLSVYSRRLHRLRNELHHDSLTRRPGYIQEVQSSGFSRFLFDSMI